MSARWLPASHDTLVQEGNYLSHSRHIWQGDTPKISAHMVRTTMSAEWDHPQIDSWAKSPFGIKGAKTLIEKTQKGGAHHSQVVTEAGSRPLLRPLSSMHQSAAPRHSHLPWHQPPGALPRWTKDFICPAAHLALEILPCKMLMTPLPTLLSPGPADWDSGTGVHYLPHWLLCVCVRFS